ncbi:uncharacterized protein LOC108210377 isoform X2 [Daucus carota subsp. sativus]|uniref:uncharacterized protein LOC108210377 isoform X2 n=1 Tax=Daucus carota subsp. sativus TaxID=79200 RepID=UPI0030835925
MTITATAAAAAVVGGGSPVINNLHHRIRIGIESLTPRLSRTNGTSSSELFSSQLRPLLNHRKNKLNFISRAADSASTQPAAAPNKSSLVTDEEFSLAKVSFGVIGLYGGVSLLGYGFGAYFNILPGSEWSAIMLTYGFPLAIIGMALKYAELKPVPCVTYADAQTIREKCATPILKQVRNDVIRYRYGDEQHLEEALKRIFQYGLGGGIARRSAPTLQMIREEVTENGRYCLVLVFEAKDLQLSDFEKRQAKFASFFGPDISAEVVEGEEEKREADKKISK